jgi:hypothetical protein
MSESCTSLTYPLLFITADCARKLADVSTNVVVKRVFGQCFYSKIFSQFFYQIEAGTTSSLVTVTCDTATKLECVCSVQSDRTEVHQPIELVCRAPSPNLTLGMVSQAEQKSTNPWPNASDQWVCGLLFCLIDHIQG